jgi:very-short-patch-repair endonuclease/predicted transcriptional regulator of viral defense system
MSLVVDMVPQTHSLAGNAPLGKADRQGALVDRERKLADVAARQHGVVSRSELSELGFGPGAIRRRRESRRLTPVHRGVYAVGHARLTRYGEWMAAVLACGGGALLSHHAAASLWGLAGRRRGPIDVTAEHGRAGRRGRAGARQLVVHRSRLGGDERAERSGIPVTSLARTLVDIAGVMDAERFQRAFEEADRLNLLELRALERACDRAGRRRGVSICRRLIDEARAPEVSRSVLEERFTVFCREQGFPEPLRNVLVLGREVDVLWPRRRVVVELDGYAFHSHRGAFEDDRARDSGMIAAGYRVVRVTHRRLTREASTLAAELRALLGLHPR